MLDGVTLENLSCLMLSLGKPYNFVTLPKDIQLPHLAVKIGISWEFEKFIIINIKSILIERNGHCNYEGEEEKSDMILESSSS